MANNDGKKWEGIVRGLLEGNPDVSCERLLDPMMGYMGVRNVADFIAYKYPIQVYLECKTCKGNTLPFSNITQNQWEGLLGKSKVNGVLGLIFVWFTEHDKVVLIDIEYLDYLKKCGKKSFNINQVIDIPNQKDQTRLGYGLVLSITKRTNPRIVPEHFWTIIEDIYKDRRFAREHRCEV